ncbi:imidazoleglycerol-phosphate dehydratase HisB [Thermosulfurimonas sp. F29]|uniref:imidazoleglycerol-phosphate dehydratase HisB n=1 Tax=Thermosulfurimonas sp. F29 TaxID=2867247 RepID=UPI001C82C9BC|nr:imidazoleglycerol-phosphate dehydratase HisB [Thermosulfurimonas sp. F29]MBX6422347.1 imidazoleglycerol-phosphate dehydratase HisB [Thermosulfurimonas sp. F29]
METVERTRKTRETTIRVRLALSGKPGRISTGVGFLDHMLELFSYHGGLGLSVEAKGDLHVDAHHTVEDVGITLGEALSEALGERKGILRYGEATIPMEESLAQVVVDLARRPFFRFEGRFPVERVGFFDLELIPEFLKALAMNGVFTLHARLLYGENAHHMAEALFKALAYALRRALLATEDGPRSTKGLL